MKIKKYNPKRFNPKPGEVYSGVPNEVYHSLHDWYSSSDIKAALVDFRQVAVRRAQKKSTEALEVGSAIHLMTENYPGWDEDLIIDSPTDSFGVKWQKVKEENPTSPVLSPRLKKEALAMALSLTKRLEAEQYFFGEYYHELTIFWIDEETGLKCKARPDLTIPGFIDQHNNRFDFLVDFKKTRKESIPDFTRDVGSYGYYISAGHYLNGINAVSKIAYDGFIFLTVYDQPPYYTNKCVLGPESIYAGWNACRKGLHIIKNEIVSDAEVIEIPQYLLNRYLE